MATIMHGRRKGSARGTPDMSSMQLKDGTDLQQVMVLTKTDWERIQTQLHRKEIEEEKIRKMREDRENLKNRSKEVVQNWGNTIAGTRNRKLEARKLREQKEEEERKLLDIEEAKYQAQQRKEAIDKAKTLQYYQTDRVKQFHGALMLTEVLKEREAQLELKKLQARANEGKDKEYMALAQREYEEAIQQDQMRAMERLAAAKEAEDFQKAQIREHMKAQKQEQLEDIKEGEELKKLALQFQLEKERLEKIAHDEKKQLLDDNRKQIIERSTLKQMQNQQEEEEDEECRIFAAAKRKMMRLRAEKEKYIHEEKQKHLERIHGKLAAQMKQAVDDEDERIRAAVEEAEAKRAQEEAEKEAKMRKIIQDENEHRSKQIKESEKKKKEERRSELETIRIRQAADEIFRRNEEEKQVRRKDEAQSLAKFHLDQASLREQKEQEDRQRALALDAANTQLLEIEEEQFQEYAQKVIQHCEKGGRNVYPLKKAAQSGAGGGKGPQFHGKGGIRPSYMVTDQSGKQMPHYQKESTKAVKANNDDVPSKKRLGFVW
ncbi:hypothetical protein CHS0354_023210 [Potamilus streckersoni]|uniref:Trichohyalin-plectin-homology domain-containing protein n=1 Tax=Potamilus streckersoni TaxID=2493646 RepID=A0AAE0SJA0_9BIVA|nr:hypothetical protein CHS0354_023210 [Potamilus streckersoni]